MDKFDILLSTTPKLNHNAQKHLIKIFGSAERIFNTPKQQLLSEAELLPANAQILINHLESGMQHAIDEMEFCNKNNITPIAATDDAYPRRLREVNDPPHVIYTMGRGEILNHNLISFVGSRAISTYGERACMKIIEQIAKKVENFAIVSGLAYGVDAAAHRAAMEFGVPTIAVLPCHLPGVLPLRHADLANAILDEGGALVTEMNSTMSSTRFSFVPRNRIIAALSEATIVVESAAKGGSLATALAAARYQRCVAALPGRITDEMSEGCNNLIKQKIAEMATSGDDIIAQLGWSKFCKSEFELNK